MEQLHPSRTTFVHDFDGVHFDCDVGYHFRARAAVARMIFTDLSSEKAYRMCQDSLYLMHSPLAAFEEKAKDMSLDIQHMRQALHDGSYALAFTSLLCEKPALIIDQAEIRCAMDRLAQHDVQHVLLTHASLDNWVFPILERQGYAQHFNRSASKGFEDIGFVPKSASVRPLASSMLSLGVGPQQTVFIEDTLRNLEIAKNAYPDLCTVWVNAEKRPQPAFVDYKVSSFAEFADFAAESFEASAPSAWVEAPRI